MYTRELIIDNANIIKERLLKAGYDISDILLFGSYYDGNPNEYSDIDIAIISKNFTGIRFIDIEKICKYFIDLVDFEIHPFQEEDFKQGSPFIDHIKNNSVKIPVNGKL